MFAGSAYELNIRTQPAVRGVPLFYTSGQMITPGKWIYTVAGTSIGQVAKLAPAAKIAATVANLDIYSLDMTTYGRASMSLVSNDGNALSLKFFDINGSTNSFVVVNPNSFVAPAGTYYVAVKNFSPIGLPIAYHLSLNIKATRAPKVDRSIVADAPFSHITISPITSPGTHSSVDYGGTSEGGVTVTYTYYGDANLDGAVDGSDYSKIDAGSNGNLTSNSSLTNWGKGDFNYDGQINGADYTLIDNAFNNRTTG